MTSSVTKMITDRQLFGRRVKSRTIVTSILESHPFVCNRMKTFSGTVNHMDIDSVDYKYLLIGYNDGNIEINEISDQNTGHYDKLCDKKLESTVNRCQWYSVDTGMLATTSSASVALIDTNTMRRVERYSFPDCRLYWSDWSANRTSSIAVGCSRSAIRIIDIRSGSSLQQITCSSTTGTVNHHMTRVVWSPHDSDCLIAGDSAGIVHIYDIRRPNRSVTTVGSDHTCCEPITCLEFTKDKTSLLTTHGVSNKLHLWHFSASNLINSNINFECPLIRPKQSKRNLNTSYLRCQIFSTNDYVFAPSEQKQLGRDVISYSLNTGSKVHSLSTSKEGSFNTSGPNCVTGLDIGSPLIYSGGNKRLCVWTPKIDSEENKKRLNKYYSDKWSDSEGD